MSTPRPLKLALVALVAGLCFAAHPGAADKASRQQQLDAVLQKIERLKQAIETKEDSKSRYIKQLRDIERQISRINQDIRRLDREISNKKSELKALRATRIKHQQQLGRENEYLAEQVYAAFTLGRQEKVKLLFSQQDPATLQRNLVYYQYFANARVDLINKVQANIDKILETESLIKQARLDLEANQQALAEQKRRLDSDRRKRESIVASLDEQLRKEGGNLSQLEEEATQLQNLINSIQEIIDTAPDEDITRRAFSELKGRLAWPVEGKVRRLFGRRKSESDLRWQGVVIEARTGDYVRAVSHGRIAFADWLRGFGNLVIIDHGNAYLSLYGHNESLFKSAGEWVEAGDVISSIGNSGGQKKSGLYFEIRKRGKPQNPTGWCKAGNQFAAG